MGKTSNTKSEHLFEFMGLNEMSLVDLGAGFASGVFKKDVRKDWQGCFGALPNFMITLGILIGLLTKIDIANPMSIFSNIDMLSQLIQVGSTAMLSVPGEVMSCGAIAMEGYDVIIFIIKHLDIAADGVTILANLASHWWNIGTDIFGFFTSLFTFNLFEVGRNAGDAVILLIE